ncbi:MAG: hypothetical protein H6704_19760 [Myxococcales bacterium]|nr:hypothetical protein [Myxococcales bacterium]
MTELAPHLQAWAAELAGYDPALALSLADPLRRLAAALGPVPRLAPTGEGEPAGFDGLTRRGDPAHLLLSEWLLADDVPDEFLRRAVDGELAFLAPRRVDAVHARRGVALFDGGPDQIGAPRLLHVVALLVLARRTRLGGGAFQWGLLQDADRRLMVHVTPAAARHLQRARAATQAAPAHLAGWLDALGPLGAEDDLWLVGGPSLDALGGPGSRLRITEVLDPDEDALEVQVLRGGARARTLRLPLPDDATATRLLRHPLRQPTVTDAASGVPTALALSANASRALCLDDTGALVAHHVPNAPVKRAGALGRVRRLAPWPGFTMLGGAYWKRKTVALSADDAKVVLARGGAVLSMFERPPDFEAGEGFVALAQHSAQNPEAVYYLAPRGRLWRVPAHGELPLRVWSEGVVATAVGGALLVEPDAPVRLCYRRFDGSIPKPIATTARAAEAVLGQGQAAWPDEAGQWHVTGVWTDAPPTPIDVPPGARVLGVPDYGPPRLWVADADGVTVRLVGEAGEMGRVTAEAPVQDVAVGASREVVVFLLTDGRLSLHAVGVAGPLYQVQPGGDA